MLNYLLTNNKIHFLGSTGIWQFGKIDRSGAFQTMPRMGGWGGGLKGASRVSSLVTKNCEREASAASLSPARSLRPSFGKEREGSDDRNIFIHSPLSFLPPFQDTREQWFHCATKKGKRGNKWVVLPTNELHLDPDGKCKQGEQLAELLAVQPVEPWRWYQQHNHQSVVSWQPFTALPVKLYIYLTAALVLEVQGLWLAKYF